MSIKFVKILLLRKLRLQSKFCNLQICSSIMNLIKVFAISLNEITVNTIFFTANVKNPASKLELCDGVTLAVPHKPRN